MIIYYTGHGDFTKGEQHFQLMLRTSNDKITDYAGYTMRQLAATVNSAARRARKLVILDCCYAAAAFNDWQKQGVDDVKRAISLQAATNFPDTSEITGTALLCACPEDKWALFKDDKPTMFSGGLVQSLLGGDDERGDFLSIGDVYELTKKAIANLHNSEAVAPLLHVPKGQREQMTSYALFPNGTRRVGPLGRRLSLIETAMSELRKQASAHTAILDEMRSSLSEITVRLRNDSEDLGDGLDLTRVKEGDGGFWTTVGGCEIRVVEGRLEDYAHATEGAIVLPCNEYFDDECVSDPRSALGSYVGRVFQGQLAALCSLVKEECRKKFGEGVERQKTEVKRAESFGAGRCLMLIKPLDRSPPIALVSTTIQRVGQGLLVSES